MSNTLVSDNGVARIDVEPSGSGTTTGVLDHVQIVSNGNFGLGVGTSTQTINITFTDSVSADNGGSGIIVNSTGGTPVDIMVRNSTIANNGAGLQVVGTGGSTVLLTRSTITGNVYYGWGISSGAVLSYADNNIDGNGAANTEPPNPLTYH